MDAKDKIKKIEQIGIETVVFLIQIYQWTLSPILGHHCRFYPSCSAYSQEAFRRKGFMRGFYMMIKRIFKCQPFHSGGIDVVR
ncbi:MAG: membrane protein insertion efficiency factor YidD [Candidatus Omnitrophica bacterium]|nr:membrane protein insertion efficiency factor YidD [Candidatus Omnitrophota bacterium]